MDLAAVGARLPFGLGLVGLHRKLGAFTHRVGEEAPYAFRSSSHGACDLPVGRDEHRARGAPDLVSLGDLPVLLEQHVGKAVLLSLGLVLLHLAPTNEREGQLLERAPLASGLHPAASRCRGRSQGL